jgi:hypothetical protein
MLLVLAAKIPTFKIDSDGFVKHRRYKGNRNGLDASWPAAIKEVNELYGLNCVAGYRDRGNTFRFILEANGRNILSEVGPVIEKEPNALRPRRVRKINEFYPV